MTVPWLAALPTHPAPRCLGCQAPVGSTDDGMLARVLLPPDSRDRWLTLCWRCALRWVEDDGLRKGSAR
jgi:hypothetical protein